MVKTKWKKSLDLEKFHPKKLKTSNFLEVLHAFSDTVLALGIYVYTSFANSYVSKKHLILI